MILANDSWQEANAMAFTLKPPARFNAYYRISTAQQGRSGLGIEARHEAVRAFLAGSAAELAQEFTEVESSKKGDRPQLAYEGLAQSYGLARATLSQAMPFQAR